MVQLSGTETRSSDGPVAVATGGPAVVAAPPAGRGDPEAAPAKPGRAEVSTTVLSDGGLAGNLVADPVIIFTGSGKAMVRLRVASSKRIRDQESGAWREGPTRFHDVVCWGQCAQNVGEHFLKGDLVVAVGVWQREQWIDHEGKPAQRTTLAARHVGLGVTFKAARYVKTIVEES